MKLLCLFIYFNGSCRIITVDDASHVRDIIVSLCDSLMVNAATWLEIIRLQRSLTYINNFSFDSHYEEYTLKV